MERRLKSSNHGEDWRVTMDRRLESSNHGEKTGEQ